MLYEVITIIQSDEIAKKMNDLPEPLKPLVFTQRRSGQATQRFRSEPDDTFVRNAHQGRKGYTQPVFQVASRRRVSVFLNDRNNFV